MADTKETIIYTSLVFAGIIISTLFSFLLNYSPFAFITLLTFYVMGYSVYMFVFLIINRKKFRTDDDDQEMEIDFQVANYISLFNMLFAACMFIVAIVLRKRIYQSVCY